MTKAFMAKGMAIWIARYLRWIHKWKFIVLIISLGITATGIYLGTKFTIKSDLLDLLPADFQTVKSLKKIANVTGGIGYLIVVAEGNDRSANIDFLDKFSHLAEKDKDVLYVDFKMPMEFIEKNGILWIPLKDLQMMEVDLKNRIDYFRKKYLSLLPEELPQPPVFHTRELLSNLAQELSKSPYHEEKNGQIVLTIIKPGFDSMDVARTQALLDRMNKFAESLITKYPDVSYQFTGLYDMKVSQIKSLSQDFTKSTIYTVIGITLALLIFYRSPKALIITVLPLIIGMVWTVGINYLLVGHMNLVSSFFISVLMGTGMETNLQIYSRFKEEYLKKKDYTKSLTTTFQTTGKAALAGILTMLSVFVILIFSNFLAFHETGILATVGVIMIFISIAINMPLLVYLIKPGFRMFKQEHEREETEKDISVRFMQFIYNRKVLIISIFAFLVVSGYAGLKNVKFEYDFMALEDVTSPSRVKWEQLAKIFKVDMRPSIMMVDSLEKLEKIRTILQQMDKDGKQFYAKHVSILDYYPFPHDDLVYRIKTVGHIRDMVLKNYNSLSPSDQANVKKYLKYLYPDPTRLEDYPDSILNALVGNDNGKPVYFYLIYPPGDIGLGLKAIDFAEKLKDLQAMTGFNPDLTSDAILIEEILNLVTNEGKFILPLSFFTILLLVWISFKSVKKAFLVMIPLVLGIYFLGVIMGVSNLIIANGLSFNYLNAIGIPILLGTGIDYSMHIFHRLEETHFEEGITLYQKWKKVVATSLALFICAITTMIGFSSMFLANYVGLRSIAWVGVLGSAIILIVSAVLMPALFFALYAKKQEKSNS